MLSASRLDIFLGYILKVIFMRFFSAKFFLYAVIKSSVDLVYDKLNRLHFSSLSLQHIFSEFRIIFVWALSLLIFQFLKNVDNLSCIQCPVSEWEYAAKTGGSSCPLFYWCCMSSCMFLTSPQIIKVNVTSAVLYIQPTLFSPSCSSYWLDWNVFIWMVPR